MKKRILTLALGIILIFGVFPTQILAIYGSYPNWTEVSGPTINTKFYNNESFIVCFTSQSYIDGTNADCIIEEFRMKLIDEMIGTYNLDRYIVNTTLYGVSSWVYSKVNHSPPVYTPLFAIVKNSGEYVIVEGDGNMFIAQQALNTLFGIFSNIATDFYQLNNAIYTAYDTSPAEVAKYLAPISQIDNDIVKEANQITQGIVSDYDKIRAIHDWVAENIYYDWELYGGGQGTRTALGTYTTKKSVCEGYSNLTAALCQAIGIPARVVGGLITGGADNTTQIWNAYQQYLIDNDLEAFKNTANTGNKENHAWNEAYVNGRWVIMDVTWDSHNDFYTNAGYRKGVQTSTYFDPNLTFFSATHAFWGNFSVPYPIVIPPVGTPPTIDTLMPAGVVGTLYGKGIIGTNNSPVTLSVESGALPDGLTMQSDGYITGTPTKAGTFTFTVKATNTGGSVTETLTIIINPATAPSITTKTLPIATAGELYYEFVSASGFAPITWSLVSGNLPTGLTLSATGQLSGTPTTAGTFNFTVMATNAGGNTSQALSIIVEIKKVSLIFQSDFSNRITTLEIPWTFDYFGQPTTYYNDNLATVAAVLSKDAYDNVRISSSLETLGFTFASIRHGNYFGYDSIHNVAYTFASREVQIKGQTKKLIAVVLRGTVGPLGISDDWLSNLTLLSSYGFSETASNIKSKLDDYIPWSPDNIYFITGHSRGGAVANALAELLPFGCSYTYTFAAPKPFGVLGIKPTKHEHLNAFNIISNSDIVTKYPFDFIVDSSPMPSISVFHYYRSGYDIVFQPNKTHPLIASKFFLLSGKLYSFVELKDLFYTHKMDIYLAYVLARAQEPSLGGSKEGAIRTSFKCPVDIEVYNSDEILLGRIVNNVVDETLTNSILSVWVDGDEKNFLVPDDEEFTFKLTGTNTGTMTYTVEAIETDTWNVTEQKTFKNVALYDGKQMISEIKNTEDLFDVQLFVINGNSIISEIMEDGTEKTAYTITTTAGTGGTVSGGGTFASGDSVTLTATANANYTFDGWYESGIKISGAGATYTFTATANRTLEARFTYVGGGSNNGNNGNSPDNGSNGGGSPNNGSDNNNNSGGSPGNGSNNSGSSNTGSNNDNASAPPATSTPKVNAISADNLNKEVLAGTVIKLKTSTADAKIYYTFDGSKPTVDSLLYTAKGITINSDTVIKAVAVKAGFTDSDIATFSYKIRPPYVNIKDNSQNIKYMAAYADKTFKPDKAATRYEIIEALNELLDIEKTSTTKAFSDVSPEKADLINLFASVGIVDGYPDGTFRGENGITRAEFIKLLTVSFKLELDPKQIPYFSDVENHWAKDYITTFASNGYILGYPDGTFKPDRQISRAEVVAIINRILKIKPKANADAVYSDLTPDHWAYGEIMAAAK